MKIFIFSTNLNYWNSIIINRLLSDEKIQVEGIFFGSSQGGHKGLKFRISRLFEYGVDNLLRIAFQSVFYSNRTNKYLIEKCKDTIDRSGVKTYSGDKFYSCLDIAVSSCDYSLLVYFNRIIPKRYINNTIINIHPGKLPSFRGVQPVFWTLLKNEKEIGVSVHLIDAGIDTGPICEMFVLPIKKRSIADIMICCSRELEKKIIPLLVKMKKNEIVLQLQNKEEGMYFSRPKASEIRKFLRLGNRYY